MTHADDTNIDSTGAINQSKECSGFPDRFTGQSNQPHTCRYPAALFSRAVFWRLEEGWHAQVNKGLSDAPSDEPILVQTNCDFLGARDTVRCARTNRYPTRFQVGSCLTMVIAFRDECA